MPDEVGGHVGGDAGEVDYAGFGGGFLFGFGWVVGEWSGRLS